MEPAELVNVIKVVDLSAKTRPAAIRSLAQAANLDDEGIPIEALLEAIEEREATAQTIVAPGFAIPHAVIDWNGEVRIVLGRSRQGVDYGTPDTEPVGLIILLVIGTRNKSAHLTSLAAVAEFFSADEFRASLVNAKDVRAIERLLREKAGLTEPSTRRGPKVPRINSIMSKQAIDLVNEIRAQAVLVVTDDVNSVSWNSFAEWEGRLLVVTSDPGDELPIERDDTHLIDLPQASLTRADRTNLGLLLSASEGLLATDKEVVCVTGPGGKRLDSVTVVKPEPQFDAMFGGKTTRRSARIAPVVILRVIALAIELAEEGREGKAIGTMFVVGDSRQVLRHAQQLVLNPFHGYSRTLRSLLDPSLGETIKEFAQLDGAFVVQADGMVLSAGTYLLPKTATAKVPTGLGTRHQAAASITSHTEALAIVVSQSTGTVSVFRNGRIVLKLERSTSARR